MPTLLRIDSSPLATETSFSRHLTTEFVERWQQTHPDGQVITRDLSTTGLAPLNAEWIGAAYTPEASLSPSQKEVLSLSDELIAELRIADEYVFGVPMHNFSVPGILKLWIDQIARAGKTFSYADGTLRGLLQNKKATFLVATGGVYDVGTPAGMMNFVEPYLRSVFGFVGVTDSTFISAGGTSRAQRGVDPVAILQPAMASIRAHLQPQPAGSR